MTSKEIRKLIEEKSELAQRASEAFQQLQGQMVLLRDMLKNTLLEEKEQPKKDTEPTEEQTTEEKK